jgi:hypothetical protein
MWASRDNTPPAPLIEHKLRAAINSGDAKSIFVDRVRIAHLNLRLFLEACLKADAP